VLIALHRNERQIGNRWAAFNVPLLRRHYDAIWMSGDTLDAINPFTLLANGLPGAAADMSNYTLVVIGLTRADGVKGFVILADHADEKEGNGAGGEELLDDSCRMALPQPV
jgi:CDP-diacylglycerol pyrophosphatase